MDVDVYTTIPCFQNKHGADRFPYFLDATVSCICFMEEITVGRREMQTNHTKRVCTVEEAPPRNTLGRLEHLWQCRKILV